MPESAMALLRSAGHTNLAIPDTIARLILCQYQLLDRSDTGTQYYPCHIDIRRVASVVVYMAQTGHII